MPIYAVHGPDNKVYEFEGPAGATPEEVEAAAEEHFGTLASHYEADAPTYTPGEEGDPRGPVTIGNEKYSSRERLGLDQPKPYSDNLLPHSFEELGATIREVPRQLGLAGRYGLEGLAQTADVVHEPVRALMNMGANAVTGPTLDDLAANSRKPMAGKSLAEMASQFSDYIGLPSPNSPTERVVGDTSRMLAGSASMVGGGQALARIPGMISGVGTALAQSPKMQALSALGSGVAGGSVREAGGSNTAQALAALAGGLTTPGLASLGSKYLGPTASKIGNAVRPLSPQAVDLQVSSVLGRQGIDWSALAASEQAALREEAAQALSTGAELNGPALRRLLDFRRIGATPTRGTLTLDPLQITREKNLSKIGANSNDSGLHGLARAENENNRTLINALNSTGASDSLDAYGTGQHVISALDRNIAGQNANINELYRMARDSQGRSFPLDGRAFADRAIQDLSDNLLGGALPADVRNHLNQISAGEVPFTVDYAEQLKTRIGNLQRASNDGSTRMALGLVRRAIDDAPVLPLGQQTPAPGARAVNHGSLPAVRDNASIGEDAVAAFTRARQANRTKMQMIEQSPALQSVYEGTATPDQFMDHFIIGKGASARDVGALHEAASVDPQARTAVRNYISQWLKDKALGGAADEVGNFSAANYNRALRTIGDQKLGIFFAPEEIDQLRSIGRVSSYMAHQPKGSAVNNSNSGALMAGKTMDFFSRLAGGIPLLNIGPQVQVGIRGMQQLGAQNITPALRYRVPQPNAIRASGPLSLISSATALNPYEDEDGQ